MDTITITYEDGSTATWTFRDPDLSQKVADLLFDEAGIPENADNRD